MTLIPIFVLSIFVIIPLTITSFTLVGNVVFAQTPTLSYENKSGGLKSQYPSDWETTEIYSDSIVTFQPKSQSSVLVDITPLSPDRSLKDAAEIFMLTNETDFKILQSKPVILNTKPAHLVLYTYVDDYGTKRVMVTSVRDDINNRLIVFSYAAPQLDYDRLLSDAGSIIKSLTFTKIADINTDANNTFANEAQLSKNIKTLQGTTQDNKPVSCTNNCIVHINGEYYPKILAIPVGTTVTWVNDDSTMHTVTSVAMGDYDYPEFDSYSMPVQGRYQYTFDKPGVFDYYSLLSPMKGKIIVGQNQSQSTDSPLSQSTDSPLSQSTDSPLSQSTDSPNMDVDESMR